MHLEVNIDVDEINKELQKAYKSIKAIDWETIESDVHESLRQNGDNKLEQEELAKLFTKNAIAISRLKSIKENFNMPLLLESVKRAFLTRDSVRAMEEEFHESIEAKVKAVRRKASGFSIKKGNANTYRFSYSYGNAERPRHNFKRNENFSFSIPVPMLKNHVEINFTQSTSEKENH